MLTTWIAQFFVGGGVGASKKGSKLALDYGTVFEKAA